MTDIDTDTTTASRLQAIFTDVLDSLLGIIQKHQVTWEEYRAATEWLTEAGAQGYEIPLMLDVFLSQTVDDVNFAARGGTESNVEGPFYVPDSQLLERPYVLPQREGEPGERLVFSGTVRTPDGSPLAGAEVDVWQASADGEYSNFHPTVPAGNLRGRLTTDDAGRFEFETVVPPSYGIPDSGATAKLLGALGRHLIRPGHIHFKLSHPTCQSITTQIYFEGDPYIDSDVVGAVKDSLIVSLVRNGEAETRCSYDFVLVPASDEN
ncbi:MAG TPA: dioxygenase [Acidimicrobiales bacterium]|nr:dioxygenase [Acidimicrobiales bacterium]